MSQHTHPEGCSGVCGWQYRRRAIRICYRGHGRYGRSIARGHPHQPGVLRDRRNASEATFDAHSPPLSPTRAPIKLGCARTDRVSLISLPRQLCLGIDCKDFVGKMELNFNNERSFSGLLFNLLLDRNRRGCVVNQHIQRPMISPEPSQRNNTLVVDLRTPPSSPPPPPRPSRNSVADELVDDNRPSRPVVTKGSYATGDSPTPWSRHRLELIDCLLGKSRTTIDRSPDTPGTQKTRSAVEVRERRSSCGRSSLRDRPAGETLDFQRSRSGTPMPDGEDRFEETPAEVEVRVQRRWRSRSPLRDRPAGETLDLQGSWSGTPMPDGGDRSEETLREGGVRVQHRRRSRSPPQEPVGAENRPTGETPAVQRSQNGSPEETPCIQRSRSRTPSFRDGAENVEVRIERRPRSKSPLHEPMEQLEETPDGVPAVRAVRPTTQTKKRSGVKEALAVTRCAPKLPEGYDRLWKTIDWAFFIEMNFLMSMFKPKFDGNPRTPLALSMLRPKEASIVRVSGNPYHHHWIVNYDSDEGKQRKRENNQISPFSHGMSWKTMITNTGGNDDDDVGSFDWFYGGLRRIVFRYGDYEATLYTSDRTVYFFLSKICKFSNVVLLKREKIDFDPHIYLCDHHANVDVSSRPCTENRVWALRHHHGSKVSSRW